jgi:putative hydrolase of HD superfamily
MGKKEASLTDFLFEVGILAQTPRSGFHYLGGSSQSVAEHSHRAAIVGFVIATQEGADINKVIKMCLFHDLAESRTNDLSWVNQQYTKRDEAAALQDTLENLPGVIKKEIETLLHEYEKRETKEAKVAKDADIIELILRLKELADSSNKMALDWVPHSQKKLNTPTGKKLAEQILQKRSDEWWFAGAKYKDWRAKNK